MKIDKPDTARDRRSGQERHNPLDLTLRGLGVASGTVVGPAAIIEAGTPTIPHYCLPEGQVVTELERLERAVQTVSRRLKDLRLRVIDQFGADPNEMTDLIDVHLQMLEGSRLIREVRRRIEKDRINPESAIRDSMDSMARAFGAFDDPYLAARIQDIRDVGNRLIRELTGEVSQEIETLAAGAIVIAHEITPSEAALLDPKRIAGFATELGGAESHTAIMARSLGIPAVLNVDGLMNAVRPDMMIALDGSEGEVAVDPSEATLRGFRDRIASEELEASYLRSLSSLPSITEDGVPISLKANIELPREVPQVLEVGAEGVGLLRSEFMFMNRQALPSEEEQFEILAEIVRGMKGRPVTIRTLDIGADKMAAALDQIRVEPDNNPALGVRAIRFSLRYRQIFQEQVRAILRVSALGPIRILLPMITSAHELVDVRQILREAAVDLRASGHKVPETLPPVGPMIEVPAAALGADHLAQVSDFFSIGTNDLTMYTLAIDRGNEQVAHLYDPFNPAVLRLIQFTAQAAHRGGIPVSICGEMAGDEVFTELLIGLGFRELSMAPQRLPRIKRRVRELTSLACIGLAEQAMDERDPAALGRDLTWRLMQQRRVREQAPGS